MRRTHGLTNQEHFDKGLFPVLDSRNESFPDGESLNDLEDRAGRAIDELVMPHIWQSLREGKSDVDIALVSHGLCISELVASLLRRDEEVQRLHKQLYAGTYAGLLNTAWTRISVDCSVRIIVAFLLFLDNCQLNRLLKLENRSSSQKRTLHL